MALFAYRAVDEGGKMSSGNLDAVNGVDLELRLRRLGLDLITFDSTVETVVANQTGTQRNKLIDAGFLTALRDAQVINAASAYGDPIALLETET